MLRRVLSRSFARRASEAGYAAVLVAIVVPVVGIGCAATAVDTGMWYVEVEQVQKAADAAALAGVPFLPQDFASARARALEVAARNGYDNTGRNSVSVTIGAKPTQLSVAITSTIDNQFGAMIDIPTATVTRAGVADYQGPAPMGSPCNTFGNEPDPGNGGGTAQGPLPLANCMRSPQFWALVEGPQTGKVQGDRYQTKGCEENGVDGCTGKTNDEYDEFGYVFVVKVEPLAIGTPIDLQLYDPMMVATDQDCDGLPKEDKFDANPLPTNPYVINSDARNRYTKDGPTSRSFCTGDSYPGKGSGDKPKQNLTTSFVLREQSDTQNARKSPVQTDTAGRPCIQQYGSFNTEDKKLSEKVFKSGEPEYEDEVSRQFHNWVSLCTFTPNRAGDYYLQVRTNVSMGGSGGPYIRSGNAAAAAETGNTTTGEGSNAFAIRAVTPLGKERSVAVAGYNHMPIFVNSDAATVQFNLIRVLPGAAGQKISFSYYDAGDAQSDGDVQVQVPTDATGSALSTPFPGGCYAEGGSAGSGTALTNCTAPFVKGSGGTSKNNGKTETITIPIPADYSCNFLSLGGCWYRVKIGFGSGSVHDVTTWDATVIGDPVRLVR